MSIPDHPGKANMVVDSLSILSMGSNAHVEQEKREFAKDVHILARVGFRLMDSAQGGIVVTNVAESSLECEVKKKQEQDLILLDLKENFHKQRVFAYEQGGDGVLKYQGRLCIPRVGELQ